MSVVHSKTLQWRHNKCGGVSNHRRFDCCPTCLSRRRLKKLQSSASLAFVRGIHRWPVDSPHKGPVTRKMFPFDDVIMIIYISLGSVLILVPPALQRFGVGILVNFSLKIHRDLLNNCNHICDFWKWNKYTNYGLPLFEIFIHHVLAGI